eukprot:2357569-Amphidinium_carterae.1
MARNSHVNPYCIDGCNVVWMLPLAFSEAGKGFSEDTIETTSYMLKQAVAICIKVLAAIVVQAGQATPPRRIVLSVGAHLPVYTQPPFAVTANVEQSFPTTYRRQPGLANGGWSV